MLEEGHAERAQARVSPEATLGRSSHWARALQEFGVMHRGVAAALAAAPIILGVLIYFLISNFHASRDLRDAVDASYEARTRIERVFSALQDLETGQRGFVLTGRAVFLEPYDSGRERFGAELDQLRRTLADDEDQQRRIASLESLARQKLVFAAQTVELRRAGKLIAAREAVSSGRGKDLMDQIRVVTNDMLVNEAADLRRETEEAAKAASRVEVLTFTLLGLLVVTLLLAGGLIAMGLRERGRILSRLREAAARQQAVFDSVLDPIIICDAQGRIEAVNAAAGRVYGYEAGEIIGRNAGVLVEQSGDSQIPAAQFPWTHEMSEAVFSREVPGLRKDGSVFPADVSVGPMRMPTGLHTVAVVRDISERKRMEALKDEFVSTVSHELRTPLTSIAGSLGLLMGGAAGVMPEKADRLLAIAQGNCQRLVRLINDILDIEKIQSGKIRFDLAPIDLRTLAHRSLDEVRPFAQSLNVSMALAEGPSPNVSVDADRLTQVLTNLLSNAAKFSPSGSIVEVSVSEEGAMARLSVRDQGPGVPEAFRARIFSKFAQADGSDTRQKGGTGLGLAIAKEITERLGGRLWFESEVGKGATFHVDLPVVGAVGDEHGPGRPGAPRLLVCEDDPDVAKILTAMLRTEGFGVEVYGRLEEAEAALNQRGPFDGLLLDLNLPDGHGLDLLERLRSRARTAELPVIIVSAEAVEGEAVSARGLQILDWIQKPLDQARLVRALENILPSDGRAPVILHLDDDPDVLHLARQALEGVGQVMSAATLFEARRMIAGRRPDVVILDIALGDSCGLDLIGLLDSEGSAIPVIVFSAYEVTDPAVARKVDAILTKSRTSLGQLARTVRTLTSKVQSGQALQRRTR